MYIETMNNAAKKGMKDANGSLITIGDVVTFTVDYREMFPSTGCGLYEITDSRHVGRGQYVFSVTPITFPATLNASHTDIDPSDLEKYRG